MADEFYQWLLEFSFFDLKELNPLNEDLSDEEESYILDSTIYFHQAKKQLKKKRRKMEKKEKQESIAKRCSEKLEKGYYDCWKLNECNVCGKGVAKTEPGGAAHKAELHRGHKFRCEKKDFCGSIYDQLSDLQIHQDLNPGH